MQPTLNPHLSADWPRTNLLTRLIQCDWVLIDKHALHYMSYPPPQSVDFARSTYPHSHHASMPHTLRHAGLLQPGHIVVLRSPRDPTQLLIKRVVGVEGDWLAAHGEPHNWRRLNEGQMWVEGDNARASRDDSRTCGPIPLSLCQGIARRVIWPPQRARVLPRTLDPVGGPSRLNFWESRRTQLFEAMGELTHDEAWDLHLLDISNFHHQQRLLDEQKRLFLEKQQRRESSESRIQYITPTQDDNSNISSSVMAVVNQPTTDQKAPLASNTSSPTIPARPVQFSISISKFEPAKSNSQSSTLIEDNVTSLITDQSNQQQQCTQCSDTINNNNNQ
jgi:hypothetical protein